MTPEALRETLINLIREFSDDLNASVIEDTKDVVIGIEDEASGELLFIIVTPA